MLLGIPGDNTYANYAEANRAFWRQKVLPLVQRTSRALTLWLAPAYGHDLRFSPDLDANNSKCRSAGHHAASEDSAT